KLSELFRGNMEGIFITNKNNNTEKRLLQRLIPCSCSPDPLKEQLP
ncbi:30820_t:CDS:2, partial [Racocetra persica]